MIQGNRRPLQGLGTPPDIYAKDYMLTLVRALSDLQSLPFTPRDLLANGLTFAAYPTSGAGLAAGQAWVDENGFLLVVRESDVFGAGMSVGLKAGRVEVL